MGHIPGSLCWDSEASPGPERCPGQHSPGSLSLLRGSSAHGICFSIPNPQISVRLDSTRLSASQVQFQETAAPQTLPCPCACGAQVSLGKLKSQLEVPQHPPPPLPAGFKPAFVNMRSFSPPQNVGEEYFVIIL